MRKTETRQESGVQNLLALLLGGLLALGIELIVLLLGSIAVSSGVLRADTAPQVTAAACLIGCFAGGTFTCGRWKARRLPAGLLTGLICFVFILLVGLFSGEFTFGTQALIELAGCIVGGGLAGVLAGRKKPKKRKTR